MGDGPSSAAKRRFTEEQMASDEFRMSFCKVLPCFKKFAHDWKNCPWAHPNERVMRRDPAVFAYTGIACPAMKTGGSCPLGDACCYAHNLFEYWLHPTRYRTQLCTDGDRCKRAICFFAHSLDQLRVPECKPYLPVESMMQQPEAAGSSAAGQPQPAPAPPPRRSSQDIMHALAHARQAQQAEQAQEAHGAGSPAEADAAAHRALAAALRALASPRQHHHQQQQLSPPAPAPWQVPRCQQQLLGAGSEGYTSCRSSLDCEQSSRPALPLPPDATIQGHSMAAPRPGPGHRLQQAAEASGPKHLDGVRQALGEAGSGLPTEHALRGTVAGRLLGLQ